MFQTNRPPVAIDTPFELRFGAYGQVDPSRIEWGLFNFVTPHWNGSRYLWEYIDVLAHRQIHDRFVWQFAIPRLQILLFWSR